MIKDYQAKLKTMEAFDLAFFIAENSGLLKDLHYENSPENLSKYENLQAILNGIKEFVKSSEDPENITLDAFLQSISLLTDADTEKEEDRDKVTIMTAHAAKGLEFKYVFVTGLEEELFPSRMSSSTREELEEERRLFYVAITRAMKQVTLSYARSRYRWGVPVNGAPSRFIREIDEEYIEQPLAANPFLSQTGPVSSNYNVKGWNGAKKKISQAEGRKSSFEGKVAPPGGKLLGKTRVDHARQMPAEEFTADDPSKIQAGMQVEHSRFGTGKVLNLEGPGPNRKATVFFQKHGQKQLLLKFARLKIIR